MVHKSRARSSSLFLMELIFAILFFSVASAVCVEFFVKAHLLSRDSDALSRAVNECAGAAEIICTSNGLPEGVDLLAQQYPEGDYPELPAEGGPAETAEVRLYYDDSFAACGQETAAYVLDIHMEQAERMIEATLEMREGSGGREAESSVYRLQVGHHIARRTDDSEG